LAIAALAWLAVIRQRSTMVMPSASPSWREGALFTLQWGVMMTAMMLPGAVPVMLLYRTVSRRLEAERRAQVIPFVIFVAVYLILWLLTGIPVYGAGVLLKRLAPAPALLHYLLALVLILAGVYQFTAVKFACLRRCESPMSFLMRRWRSNYATTLNIAVLHTIYCLGCCWALMVVLVAAGAMSLPWVLAISVVVFAEKVLPRGQMTAVVIGVILVAAGIAIALQPEWALALRPHAAMSM
jgi:predicted metal-binding membrane protein